MDIVSNTFRRFLQQICTHPGGKLLAISVGCFFVSDFFFLCGSFILFQTLKDIRRDAERTFQVRRDARKHRNSLGAAKEPPVAGRAMFVPFQRLATGRWEGAQGTMDKTYKGVESWCQDRKGWKQAARGRRVEKGRRSGAPQTEYQYLR